MPSDKKVAILGGGHGAHTMAIGPPEVISLTFRYLFMNVRMIFINSNS